MTLIIVAIIVVVLISWIISVQRRLVAMDENINNAMSQIGGQLSSRFDALTALLELTKGYAAPEQYGIFQSDERADIFSLGVLLNIMLTGKHPSREMAAGKMGRIVRKCTMTAPEQRYQSARALMEVL